MFACALRFRPGSIVVYCSILMYIDVYCSSIVASVAALAIAQRCLIALVACHEACEHARYTNIFSSLDV
jgi:hypothetical protein